MIVAFIDLSGSTAALRERGELTAIPERVERMESIERAMIHASSKIRRVGSRRGDEWLFMAPNDMAIEVFNCILQIQSIPSLLQARWAVGIGGVMWHGKEFDPSSDVDGTVLDSTSRLLKLCPSGGVAMTHDYYLALGSKPVYQAILTTHTDILKGIEHPVQYWITNKNNDHVENTEKEFGDMDQLEVGELKATVRILTNQFIKLEEVLKEGIKERREDFKSLHQDFVEGLEKLHVSLVSHTKRDEEITINIFKRLTMLDRWLMMASGMAVTFVGVGIFKLWSG